MYVLNGQPVTEVVFEAYKAERDAHFRALAKRSGITLRVTSLEESSRRCEGCDADISDRPSNHTVCLDCYRAGNRGQKRSQGRNCEWCSADISDRPDSFTVCLDCFRAGNQSGGSGSAQKQVRGRHCQNKALNRISIHRPGRAVGAMRRLTLRASALVVSSLIVCFTGVGGSESDEVAVASASGQAEVTGDTLQPRRDWPSDVPGGLGQDDLRVLYDSMHEGHEPAWNESMMCPATWHHLPESKRRILQLNDTTAYSGYNFPGSEGPEDRPYVLPYQIPPPPPPPLPPCAGGFSIKYPLDGDGEKIIGDFECLDECPPGYRIADSGSGSFKECVLCPENCHSCIGTSCGTCVECDNGFNLMPDNTCSRVLGVDENPSGLGCPTGFIPGPSTRYGTFDTPDDFLNFTVDSKPTDVSAITRRVSTLKDEFWYFSHGYGETLPFNMEAVFGAETTHYPAHNWTDLWFSSYAENICSRDKWSDGTYCNFSRPSGHGTASCCVAWGKQVDLRITFDSTFSEDAENVLSDAEGDGKTAEKTPEPDTEYQYVHMGFRTRTGKDDTKGTYFCGRQEDAFGAKKSYISYNQEQMTMHVFRDGRVQCWIDTNIKDGLPTRAPDYKTTVETPHNTFGPINVVSTGKRAGLAEGGALVKDMNFLVNTEMQLDVGRSCVAQPPAWPSPTVDARAFRNPPSTLVDLFVDYLGIGTSESPFAAVDRYYYSHDFNDVNVANFSNFSTPFEDIRHTQILNVPRMCDEVFVRLADAYGTSVSAVARVPIVNGSGLSGAWGPGNSIRVHAHTLWELISAMRDQTVTVIELQRHIGLAGVRLPVIGPGRDLTIIGACGHINGPKNVTFESSTNRRRHLQQVQFKSTEKDIYTGAHGDLFGPESQTLLYKQIAEILDLHKWLNETEPFVLDPIAPFPVYGSDTVHYPCNKPAPAVRSDFQSLHGLGNRFMQAKRPLEYFAQGTIYGFGWVSKEVGPLGGAAMDVPENYVDVPVTHVYTVNLTDPITNVTAEVNITNTTVVRTYVVPLKDRCVVDGLDTSALFSVGDGDSPDCRWPKKKVKRFRPAQGGAVGAVVDVPLSAARRGKRWYDDGAGTKMDDLGDYITTATGSFSPWGNDNADTPKPLQQALDTLGEFRTQYRRCGRLQLQGLVLRGGWSNATSGAGITNNGGQVVLEQCVVEGMRTGPGSGKGGAVSNRGGSLEIINSVFRENVAARGLSGTENTTDALDGTDFANNLYSHHSGYLSVDYESRFDGVPWRITTSEEAGR